MKKLMVSLDEIKKIARLANLTFEPAELELFAGQFSQILDYIAQLSTVDTSGVEPTFHALPEIDKGTVIRVDEVRPSFDPELSLSNAPDKENNLFKVPKVID